MDNIFKSLLAGSTARFPVLTLTKVDDTSLKKFRIVINKVKEKTKSAAITIEYDVMSEELTIIGTAVDLFYFGYYIKELE